MTASFDSFIAAEQVQYDSKDGQRFAVSLYQIRRYLGFCEIIKQRHQDAETKAAENFRRLIAGNQSQKSGPLTTMEWAEMQKNAELYEILHLETESFFVFSKITLDKIAHFIRDYFGSTPNLSLRSHHQWCKNYEKFVDAKNLITPEGLKETLTELQTIVADFRDKNIVHFGNPRAMFLTYITAENTTNVGTTFLYPKDTDQANKSPGVNDVYQRLHHYLELLKILVEKNRNRSRYSLRGL